VNAVFELVSPLTVTTCVGSSNEENNPDANRPPE